MRCLRTLIETNKSGPLEYDLIFDPDPVDGPGLILRGRSSYHFYSMGKETLREYCANVVDRSLFENLPPFMVSQKWFGFGGVFIGRQSKIQGVDEYRATLAVGNCASATSSCSRAEAIAATLSVLFQKSEFASFQGLPSEPRQLFCCTSGTRASGDGYWLLPILPQSVCDFLLLNSHRLKKEILEAMMWTYIGFHDGNLMARRDGFRVELSASRFHLSIPDGSGTNLNLPESGRRSNCWRLASHNVGSAVAQLQLLAGLGAIFRAIRDGEMSRGLI